MKTKILIVEHDSNDMKLIQLELKKGDVNYIAEIVQTETEYKKALHKFQPDIILSNYTFPSFDGLTALRIREKLVPQTPFIFVSESIDKENADALIKNGVTDFVLKKRLFTLIDKINRALHKAEIAKLNKLLKQSEEKRTEQLSQNESKYQSLIESSMDAILLTVKDGQILTANAAACVIFNMTHEEICKSERSDIVDPADPRLQILLAERNRTGKAKGELLFKRKNGSKFPGEVTSVVFTDAYGQEKTSMTIRDITERKQAEDKQIATSNALQQALNDRNNILDSSLDVICSFDKEGRFVSLNAASECIWGYKSQELIGKKYIDLVFPEDVEKTINADTVIRSGAPVTTFENRYIHKNGSIVPILWSSRWDEKDKLFYSTAKNATEKKNLEKAFEIERQRFIDLYLQAPSCMGILKGPNHVYEMANPLYLQLIDKKDIIGKTVKEVLPELEAQGIFKFLDTVYQTGETFSANEMLVKFDFHGNGKLVDTYLNFIYQAHRNIDGTIDGILFFAIDVTEQVLSRKKIEESKKRYRELIENLPVATYSCDAEGRVMIYNKAAADLWGREPEIGKDLWFGSWKIYNENGEPLPVDSCPMAIALKEERAITNEEIIIERPNGDKLNVLPYPVPIFDSSGRISGAINMLMDITEIKNTELALKESEKKYRQIVETAQEGIWLIDETNKTTFVNTKMGEILEYTREEMMDKEIHSFMDEKGKQIVDKLLLRREEKYSRQSRFKFISKNGKEIWTRISANPIFDEAGVYKGSLAMVTDITENKKAEENLEKQNKELAFLDAEKENRAAELVAANHELAFQNEEKGNRAAELVIANKELAFQNDEKENRAAELVIANNELAFQNEEKENRAAELIIANHELAFQNEEKENRAAELVIANKELAFQNEEKENRAAELVIANHELEFQNEEKENRATELIITNNELIKTNTELDRFVYSVSHDLRSPLTSVLGLISFIEEESQEVDTLEHVKMIRNSINRLDEFIKNILSYSRNNRTGLEVKIISLQKTVIAIVDSLHSMKQAKGIHFDIDIKELQPFYSDSLRFNTILENLISNAIKYHKKNQVDSYIKITGQSDHEKLELTIADNGIGISPAHHNKIFDMFFRISGKTEGSGIGLYIVKDTVEKLQGTIEVQSEKEIGTTFIITLKNLKP